MQRSACDGCVPTWSKYGVIWIHCCLKCIMWHLVSPPAWDTLSQQSCMLKQFLFSAAAFSCLIICLYSHYCTNAFLQTQIHCTLRWPNWLLVVKGDVCLRTPGVVALTCDSAGSQLCLATTQPPLIFLVSLQPTVNFHNYDWERVGRVLLKHKRHLEDLLHCQLVSELSTLQPTGLYESKCVAVNADLFSSTFCTLGRICTIQYDYIFRCIKNGNVLHKL